MLFKIRRLQNGFSFLQNKNKNGYMDIFIINICVFLIFIYFLIGILDYNELTRPLFIAFIIFTITLIIGIQNTFTLYQKRRALEGELKKVKEENCANLNKIEELSKEKYNFSKLTHEFYNRMEALEHKVSAMHNNRDFQTEFSDEVSLIDSIRNLTHEYTESTQTLNERNIIAKTDIEGIDTMFLYMQSECKKHDIMFNLQISGYINSLIKNQIPQNKLETLLGDLIRNAIIAVNSSNSEYKSILVDVTSVTNCYELSVYDSGIEFEIDTLIKLGLTPVTTHKDTGGSGFGFISTFETLKECKASIIIEEQNLNDTGYIKAVKIVFDGKCNYIIRSHRHQEIQAKNKEDRLIIQPV